MAHEYGWAKNDILENVYFDELYIYYQRISKRKLDNYMMLLSISENPHVKDRRSLWDILKNAERDLDNKPEDNKFDEVSMEVLKARMRANPRIIIK